MSSLLFQIPNRDKGSKLKISLESNFSVTANHTTTNTSLIISLDEAKTAIVSNWFDNKPYLKKKLLAEISKNVAKVEPKKITESIRYLNDKNMLVADLYSSKSSPVNSARR
jgi:hypothetical protein